jgi:Cu+-exporting ATPase
VRIIRQNILIFAFGVNGFGVVLTAWLWPVVMTDDWWYSLGPLAGVIYHQLGSLAVLLNSMRLLWFERRLESAKVTRVSETFKRVDQWMERHLDVDEALHWVSHHWRRVLAGAVVVTAAIWALSGLTQIGPGERAIVLRFGKPVAVLEPGLTYCWPWPVDRIVRVQPDLIRDVQVGFRSTGPAEKGALSWDSPHGGEDAEELSEQALMITGENDLVEVQATVRYKVASAEIFLFDVKDVDKIVTGATESVLRTLIASRRFVDLLTQQRENLQAEALRRLRLRCGEYPLGITIEGFALHDLHPPRKVVDAYYQVTRAMELRDKSINDAKAAAVTELRGAEANYMASVLRAETLKAKTIYEAEARWAEVLAWEAARKELTFDREWHLVLELVDQIHAGKPLTKACEDYEAARQAALKLQGKLISYRLFWERFKQGVQDRDILLIDVDASRLRRQMMLFDLDVFRTPLPIFQDRTLPPPGPIENKGKGQDDH